jgi:hypothetical protein
MILSKPKEWYKPNRENWEKKVQWSHIKFAWFPTTIYWQSGDKKFYKRIWLQRYRKWYHIQRTSHSWEGEEPPMFGYTYKVRNFTKTSLDIIE